MIRFINDSSLAMNNDDLRAILALKMDDMKADMVKYVDSCDNCHYIKDVFPYKHYCKLYEKLIYDIGSKQVDCVYY